MKKIAIYMFLILGSCGQEQPVSSESTITNEQLNDLKIRSSRNDLAALRELQMHYDFNENDRESAKIHEIRLRLNDPEALDYEAHALVSLAESSSNIMDKKKHLNKAVGFARQSAKLRGLPAKDISNDATVKFVQRELAQFDADTKQLD